MKKRLVLSAVLILSAHLAFADGTDVSSYQTQVDNIVSQIPHGYGFLSYNPAWGTVYGYSDKIRSLINDNLKQAAEMKQSSAPFLAKMLEYAQNLKALSSSFGGNSLASEDSVHADLSTMVSRLQVMNNTMKEAVKSARADAQLAASEKAADEARQKADGFAADRSAFNKAKGDLKIRLNACTASNQNDLSDTSQKIAQLKLDMNRTYLRIDGLEARAAKAHAHLSDVIGSQDAERKNTAKISQSLDKTQSNIADSVKRALDAFQRADCESELNKGAAVELFTAHNGSFEANIEQLGPKFPNCSAGLARLDKDIDGIQSKMKDLNTELGKLKNPTTDMIASAAKDAIGCEDVEFCGKAGRDVYKKAAKDADEHVAQAELTLRRLQFYRDTINNVTKAVNDHNVKGQLRVEEMQQRGDTLIESVKKAKADLDDSNSNYDLEREIARAEADGADKDYVALKTSSENTYSIRMKQLEDQQQVAWSHKQKCGDQIEALNSAKSIDDVKKVESAVASVAPAMVPSGTQTATATATATVE